MPLLPVKTPQTATGFNIDKATTLTPAERRLYQDFIDTEAGGTKTADRNFIQNWFDRAGVKKIGNDANVVLYGDKYVHSDSGKDVNMMGLSPYDIAKYRAQKEGLERQKTDLAERADTASVEFDPTMSGSEILERVTKIEQEKSKRSEALTAAENAGLNPSNLGGLSTSEIIIKTDDEETRRQNTKTTESPQWTYRADRDKKYDEAQLASDELALATLEGTLAAAKMQNEQSILDREYLDRRDQRDYDYRIKKDDQEQLDKIFALILGGVDRMF